MGKSYIRFTNDGIIIGIDDGIIRIVEKDTETINKSTTVKKSAMELLDDIIIQLNEHISKTFSKELHMRILYDSDFLKSFKYSVYEVINALISKDYDVCIVNKLMNIVYSINSVIYKGTFVGVDSLIEYRDILVEASVLMNNNSTSYKMSKEQLKAIKTNGILDVLLEEVKNKVRYRYKTDVETLGRWIDMVKSISESVSDSSEIDVLLDYMKKEYDILLSCGKENLDYSQIDNIMLGLLRYNNRIGGMDE